MISFDYYTFNGVEKKPVKGLVFNKRGELDRRFAINRGWRLRNRTTDLYAPKILDNMFRPSYFSSLKNLFKK